MGRVPIRVETYLYPHIAPALRKLESLKDIDHANPSDRKWLASHCFWALRNERVVVTYPLESN